MKIRRLTWRRYRIPLRHAFVTSAGSRMLREGFIVRIDGEDGLYGLGEVAPLRHDSGELARVLAAIEHRVTGLAPQQVVRTAQDLETPDEIAAAIRCGLDIAACDLLAKAAGIPVARLLGGPQRRSVPVNATVSADAPEAAARIARSAVERGFGCVKLKVGMMGDIAAECELVSAVREAVGAEVLLRLDANQAWDRKTAIATIKALECFGLELVEQPVAARDVEGLAAVRRAVRTPIAADEAVRSLDSARAVIEHDAAEVLMLKPMIVGGLRPALQIIDMAVQRHVHTIVTTTIDSGAGIAAALHLAACLEGEMACGLATAELLESDLTSSTPQPHHGHMDCPDTPGLGVAIDEAKAAPYLERA